MGKGEFYDLSGAMKEEGIDDLGTVVVYQQTLRCPQGKTVDNLKDNVDSYVDKTLNNETLTFYKAQTYVSDSRTYVVTFYAFARSCVTPKVQDFLKDQLKELEIENSQLMELKSSVERDPNILEFEDEVFDTPSCNNIPGSNPISKFLHWWLIVPRAQWDFFDLLYQLYTFDITHQGFLLKAVHFFTIPCNAVFSMVFLAQFNFIGLDRKYGYGACELNLALLLLLILSTLYIIAGFIRKCWVWGMSTAFTLTVCWFVANLWFTAYRVSGNPWYNPTTTGSNPIMWSYIISLLQTGSHTLADKLPPYITGLNHWEAVHVFLCKRYTDRRAKCRSCFFIFASVACLPILSVAVTWFSWPHLIGSEVFYIMAGIGYKPSFLKKFLLVAEKCELSGDPLVEYMPTKVDELCQSAYSQKLKEYGLIPDNASRDDIIKTVNTLKLTKTYFSHGILAEESHHKCNVKSKFHGQDKFGQVV